jgi:transposase
VGCRRKVKVQLRTWKTAANITLLFLPPYAPELNPKENLWDEIREKIFKNYALKSMDEVHAKLNKAIGSWNEIANS